MEGGIEDYHVPWIHPQMGTYGGTFTPEYDDQDVYVGFSTRADANRTGTREVDIEQSLPVFANSFENLPDDGLGAESIIVMIPPSAVIAVVPNHVMTAVLQPEQKDLTIQRRSFQFLGTSATDPAKKSIRQKVRDTWGHGRRTRRAARPSIAVSAPAAVKSSTYRHASHPTGNRQCIISKK